MITIDRLDRELIYNSYDPVFVGGFPVYPTTIRDIRRMGYQVYCTRLGILCITDDEISEILGESGGVGVPFYFLISILEHNEVQRQDVIDAFMMVCREIITWDIHSMEIRTENGVLTPENFSDFQNVVRERNKFDLRRIDENPADERTRALQKRSRELDKRRAKNKGNDDGVTLSDLVSICAAKMHVHPDVIGDYDMYQLNDVLGRFKTFDDYDTNINALLHGAKKEDVDLKYWIGGNKSLFSD